MAPLVLIYYHITRRLVEESSIRDDNAEIGDEASCDINASSEKLFGKIWIVLKFIERKPIPKLEWYVDELDAKKNFNISIGQKVIVSKEDKKDQ